MSKRVGLLAMLGVLSVIAAAAVVAQAQSDPAALSCEDEYGSIGFSHPSADSLFPTPTEAAAAFLAGTVADGKPIPPDAELVEVGVGDIPGEKLIAARIDGKTLALLTVVQDVGGWAVEHDVSC